MSAAPAVERLPMTGPDASRPARPSFARLRSRVSSWGVAGGQPPGLIALVVGVCALGLLGALLVAAVLGEYAGGDRLSVALGLVAVTAAAELVAVRLRHGDSTEELTLFEAAVVVDVLLLSPGMAVIVPVLGLALASAVKRRSVVKSAFNLGTYALSTVVLVGTFRLVAGSASPFAARSVLGLTLGTVGFAALNLGCLARVLALVSPASFREVVRDGWRLSAVMALGNVALGTVVVSVGQSSPTLLPFTALPAAALTYAYRSASQRVDERDRAARLLDLSQALVGRLDADEMVASFLTSARRAFRADRARVVLDVGITAWPVVVEVDAGGVVRRQATTADVALLERPARGQAAALVRDGLPDVWAEVLLAPLEAEGLRLGVLALAADARGSLADAVLLTPLASALAVALRGAEHLERVVEETSKLKVVVDHSSDGIFVVDGGGRVLVWNPAMAAVTGVPEDEAHGVLSELVHALDTDGQRIDPLSPAFALTPEAPRRDVEMAIVRPDGEERWVRCSHAGLFDDRRLVRDVVIVHDVTRQREVERLKADFIATVSHELRTPVTPIKGYADLLRRRGDKMTPEKRNECLDIIGDRVNHLARLVEDLLLASRISSPTGEPSHDITLGVGDLVALAKRAAGDFEAADAARMHLMLPDAPVVVSCDPLRTVQVVGNLISNALKYSPPNTQVDVAVTAYDGRARVSVTDRGRGVPADQLEAIFDKFHRVEDPLTMTTSGTGLGLYIARQLSRAMDGDVHVRSTLGAGSTFVLVLPLAETVPTPRLPAASPERRSAAR